MSALPVIDSATISSLRTLNTGGTDDFFQEIVGLFDADMLVRIAELEQSLAAGDRLKFARAAHSIKGSAANMGAKALQAAAERLEGHAQRTGLEGTAGLLAELKDEAGRAKAALEKIISAPRG